MGRWPSTPTHACSARPCGAASSLTYAADPERHLYLVASGPVRVNGVAASKGDGIAITGEEALTIEASDDAELVLVDAR